MDDFGGEVRRARQARPWTQEQLARAAGVNEKTVRRVEAGERPNAETVLALSAALGLDSTLGASATARRDALPGDGTGEARETLGLLARVARREMPGATLAATDADAWVMAAMGPGGEARADADLERHPMPRSGLGLACASTILCLVSTMATSVMTLNVVFGPDRHPWALLGCVVAVAVTGVPTWVHYARTKRHCDACRRNVVALGAREGRRTLFGMDATSLCVWELGDDGVVSTRRYALASLTDARVREHAGGRHVSVGVVFGAGPDATLVELEWLPGEPSVAAFADDVLGRVRGRSAARGAATA